MTNTCVGVLTLEKLLDFASENEKSKILSLKLDYGDVFGSERLRNDISKFYSNAKLENLVITHGAVSANALVMLSLLEKGDKVISFLPIYEQHYSIPKSIGAEVTELYLKEENNWLPDLQELRKYAKKGTKLICLNNPNNPTGSVIEAEYLKKIVEIARECGAYVLCDEVYRGLTHNGNPFTTSIFDLYEKGISTCSMSKTFSLPGLRLGWICANSDVVKKVEIQRPYHVI